jgi:hypothetical protein
VDEICNRKPSFDVYKEVVGVEEIIRDFSKFYIEIIGQNVSKEKV